MLISIIKYVHKIREIFKNTLLLHIFALRSPIYKYYTTLYLVVNLLHKLNFQVSRISLSFLVDWFRGGAIQFFGTKRHHDKWLKASEDYVVKGCFSMTELGHGSNVCESCLIILYITLQSKWLSIVSAILTDYICKYCSGSRYWNSHNIWFKHRRVCHKYTVWISSEVLDWRRS